MKNKTRTIRNALLGVAAITIGLFAMGPAPATAETLQEGVFYKVRLGNTNYCNLKFPAIQERTLSWDRPQLHDPRTGPIIDFYGPCDYDPTGEQAVHTQRLERARTWPNHYGG